MGINAAIARVKERVKQGGLPSVMADLGVPLRSASIPYALRPAASLVADLLRVPRARRQVVSLDEAGAATCPVTGATGDAPPAHEMNAEAVADERAEKDAQVVVPEKARSPEVKASNRKKAEAAPTPARGKTAPRAKENGRGKEKVAAKSATANTSARPGAQPATKQPSSKATGKKK